jgi:imidazolonepropionase-like amidohydrolase
VCINILSQTGGHGDAYLLAPGLDYGITPDWIGRPPQVVDGVDEMRKTVRALMRAGVDWIKLCATGGTVSPSDDPLQAQFAPEELAVAVFEGRRRGIPVFAHAYGGEGLTDAVAAGVRSIEHGVYITEEQAAQMAAAGCFLGPTLAIAYDVVRWAEEGRILPLYAAQKAVDRLKPYLGDQVKIARAAGVKMTTGTDYIHREEHGNNLEELTYLYEAGLTAEETLLAATANGAELCGVSDRYGRIAEGYVFDAVVLGRDPSDMTIFRDHSSVVAVLKGGVCAKGQELLDERSERVRARSAIAVEA